MTRLASRRPGGAGHQLGQLVVQRPARAQQFDRVEVRAEHGEIERLHLRDEAGQVARHQARQRAGLDLRQGQLPGNRAGGELQRECA